MVLPKVPIMLHAYVSYLDIHTLYFFLYFKSP